MKHTFRGYILLVFEYVFLAVTYISPKPELFAVALFLFVMAFVLFIYSIVRNR